MMRERAVAAPRLPPPLRSCFAVATRRCRVCAACLPLPAFIFALSTERMMPRLALEALRYGARTTR